MKVKTFNELGCQFNIKKKEIATPVRKCRKCGTELRNIPNTNVWVCDGTRKIIKDGKTAVVACNNTVLSRRGV